MKRILLLILVVGTSAYGVTSEWDNTGSGSWTVPTNWSPNTVPNSFDDTANLFNAITSPSTITLPVNISLMTLEFDSAQSYSISGVASLRFNGTPELNIANTNGNGSHVINAPVVLESDSLSITHDSTAFFTFLKPISGAGGLGYAGNLAGGILNLEAANTYMGPTEIAGGVVLYGVDGALPAGNAVTVGNGAGDAATLRVSASMSAGNAFDLTIDSDGTLEQEFDSSIFLSKLEGSGDVTLSTTSPGGLFEVDGTVDSTFSGEISGGVVQVGTPDPFNGSRIVKGGTSTLTLSGTNLFVNRLFIRDNAIVRAASNDALSVNGANSGTYVQSGGTLELSGNAMIDQKVFLNGLGGGTGALLLPSGVVGDHEITQDVSIGWSGVAVSAEAVTIGIEEAGGNLILQSLVGSEALTKEGPGQLSLEGAAANTFSGLTTVADGTLFFDKTAGLNALSGELFIIETGTAQWGANDQLPDTLKVTIGGGTFDLDGATDTIGELLFIDGAYTSGGGTLTLSNTIRPLSMRDVTIDGPLVFSGATGEVLFDSSNNGTGTLSGTVDLGAINRPFNIENGSAATDFLISGVISNGGLIKQGAGTLELMAANTYAGPTTVSSGLLSVTGSISSTTTVQSGGTLLVNGSVTSSPLTVDSGGILTGDGTITGNVDVSGTLAPGDGIGTTMSVTGNVTMMSGSDLRIPISPTAENLLAVTGGYTIDPGSTLNVDFTSANFTGASTRTIVTASTGVTGQFSTVNTNLPVCFVEVLYLANQIDVEIGCTPFSPVIIGGNAGNVAACIDAIDPPLGTDLGDLVNQLRFAQSVTQLRDALNQWHPANFTALALAQEQASVAVGQSIQRRLQQVPSALCCCCADDCGCNFWADLVGQIDWQKSGEELQGYRSQQGAFIFGADRPYWFGKVGLFTAYSHSSLDWHRKGGADIDSIYLGTYASHQSCWGYVSGALYGAYNKYRTRRKISYFNVRRNARGSHSGAQFGALVEVGKCFLTQSISVNPFVSLHYLSLWEGAFGEQGAGALDLSIRSKYSDLLRTEVGARFSTCWCGFTPYVNLGYVQHSRFNGRGELASLVGTSCIFTARGFNSNRPLAHVGTGVSWCPCNGKYLFTIGYRAEVAGHYQLHEANVQLFRHF